MKRCILLFVFLLVRTIVYGTPGASGPPVPPGTHGSAGEKGYAGQPGSSGSAGEKGYAGQPGSSGSAGETGPSGSAGEKGYAGHPGSSGSAGEKGYAGQPGSSGSAGEKGPSGSAGGKGYAGQPGSSGSAGEKGDAGQPGSSGSAGEKGDAGQSGDAGPPPVPGAPGSPGIRGNTKLIDSMKGNDETHEHGGYFEEGWKDNYSGPQYYQGPKDGPNITLSVTIGFYKRAPTERFPLDSCLHLKLEDTSRMDAPAIINYEDFVDLSQKSITNPYVFEVSKPKVFHHHYHVNAVINVGWCSKGTKEWIRVGDYLDEPKFAIVLTNEKNKYVSNLKLKRYD